MKKLFCLLLFAAMMTFLGTAAWCGTETYETKVASFSVDVPDGWKSVKLPDGCAVQTKDDANSISFQFMPLNPKMTLKDTVKMMIDTLKMQVTSEDIGKEYAIIEGSVQGHKAKVLIVQSEMLMAVVSLGPKQDEMANIFKTLKVKKFK